MKRNGVRYGQNNAGRKTGAGRSGRVREELNEDFGEGLKGRTPNVQRPTSNVQRKARAKRNGRVREEPNEDFGEGLKGRTPDAQRPTSNVQRKARAKRNARVREEPNEDFGEGLKGRTPNAQRPTPNAPRKEERSGTKENRYDLEDRLLDYAARIVRLVDALPPTSAGKHLADQLLRSGTSSLGNHGELQGAESRKDFIHKLRVCLKEIEESWRWLRLIHRVPMLAPSKVEPLLAETKATRRFPEIFVLGIDRSPSQLINEDFLRQRSHRREEQRMSASQFSQLGVGRWTLDVGRFFLPLIQCVPTLAPSNVEPMLAETEALIRIFSASIRTGKKNKG